ncbi:hypothetical protein QUF74_09430 [Candidatus Halobeggiatoa sp. HSG11]|nr:hypothetical protein [Candidatus Halobeggiatoa sp. HSG11]
MKTLDNEMNDEIRNEYDLTKLRIRKMDSGRKSFNGIDIHLETDVAKIFPDSKSVNEALRFLIRINQQNI